jgi:hypothetical protein
LDLGYRESLFVCLDAASGNVKSASGKTGDGADRRTFGERNEVALENWRVSGFPDGLGPASRFAPWNEAEGLGRFAGSVRYEARFRLSEASFPAGLPGEPGIEGGRLEAGRRPGLLGRLSLDLGEVGEMAIVSLNGAEAGMRMWRPYRFELRHLARPGENILSVEVRNNVAWKYSGKGPRSGLLGPVLLVLET